MVHSAKCEGNAGYIWQLLLSYSPMEHASIVDLKCSAKNKGSCFPLYFQEDKIE